MTSSLTSLGPRSLVALFSLCYLWLNISPVSSAATPREDHSYDVLIYGCTASGLTAAVQTVRMNKTVGVVCPEDHIGGLITSGLGWTDSKNGDAIGGIAREFFEKVYNHYKSSSAWNRETRENYLAKNKVSQPGPPIDESKKVQWTFEPHVAEAIWEDWMYHGDIPIFKNEPISRDGKGVKKDGNKIVSIATTTGKTFSAKMFIDAGYDGDLMAEAGIPFSVGRESSDDYGESYAGLLFNEDKDYGSIDPYVKKGDPSSGLLPGIQRIVNSTDDLHGQADSNRLQSYNFRLSLTKNGDNKIPFSKPDGYNELDHELLLRYVESGYKGPFFTSQLMPNLKTDTNAAGLVSTDLMGGNYDGDSNYAIDSDSERAAAAERHKTYTEGFFWTLANHDRVPQSIRDSVGDWGYAKDEWGSNNNWPYQIYIRESRRMKGAGVMTQSDILTPKAHPGTSVVALGCYNLDIHQVERVVVESKIYDEGLVHVSHYDPYPVWYTSIISDDTPNFLNPVTLSATHVAYGSIRMEPTWMILGQSAATAAVMALESGVAVQDVNQQDLYHRLKADGQNMGKTLS